MSSSAGRPGACLSVVWSIFALAACLFVANCGAEDPKPIFHTQFSVGFNETTKILFKKQTEGKWWYDAIAKAEVVHRESGQGDRYCGSIHPLTVTPCKHVVTEGKRYLIFPELGECCMCCTAEQGCGILRPDWLEGATYEGAEELRGIQTYKFNKPGLQANYYWVTADSLQLPVELDQVPNDNQTFHLDTFSSDPIDPALLEIPPNCHTKCPISSICTLLSHKFGPMGAALDPAVEAAFQRAVAAAKEGVRKVEQGKLRGTSQAS